MSIGIETTVEEFNSNAEDSKALLNEILSLISKGQVPDVEVVEKLDVSLDTLRCKYNEIYNSALSQIPADEMPEEGSPVATYIEAVKKSLVVQYKKQLKAIKEVLEKFISVQSLVSNYAAALRPYQDQAAALMERLCCEEMNEIEKLESEVEGPKLFLKALTCGNLDSDEGMECLDQAAKFYSRWVQYGLVAEKYFILEENKKKLTTENEEVSGDDEHLTDMQDDVALGAENHTEETLSEKDEKADEGEEYAEIVEEENSEFVKKILDSELLITAKDKVGVLSVDKSINEDKKISASIFQNDVRKGNEKALKLILKVLVEKNSVNARYFALMAHMPANLADGSLDYLQKKGYLRKYTLMPGGSFYCASPRLMKALTFKNAAKIIGLHQLRIDAWGETIDDKNTSAASRLVSEKLHCDTLQRFLDKGILTAKATRQVYTEAAISKNFTSDGRLGSDVNVVVFWDNTKECDFLLKGLKELFKDKRPTDRITFAALNLAKAKCLADIILDEMGESLVLGNVYLYSLADDDYYTYPECNKTDVLEVAQEDMEQEHTQEARATEEVKADIGDKKDKEAPDYSGVREESGDYGGQKNKTIQVGKQEVKNSLSAKPASKEISEDGFGGIIGLINLDRLYAATAYAKALDLQKAEPSMEYRQLAYAVNDPMEHCIYSTDNVFSLIGRRDVFTDALMISTAIRTFFSNQVRYDYNIKSYYGGIKEYKMLSDFPTLSKVLYSLMEFKDNYQSGMDAYADYRSKSIAESEQEMKKLQQETRIFYDNYVVGQKKENASQKRFIETKKLMFSVNTDMGQYLKAVVDGEYEMLPLTMDFLQVNFYKEDSTIEVDTIDADKLWRYIIVFWEKAGEHMTYRRHADLMSHLRNNIISITTKAVQLLVRWCDLVNRNSNHIEDEGDIAYKKIRKPLIENLETSIKDIQEVCETAATEEEIAGLRVLLYTLNEIHACLIGNFEEETRKYFYVPFLLTDDVMLDVDYIPDFEMHSASIHSLQPTERILEHVKNVKKYNPTFKDRLTEILDDKGDDYGAARLIVDYLMKKDSSEELAEISENILSGEEYAHETAQLRKDDFVGNLELAQSYGQIDNSVEDKKEKILQIINEWNEWAVETSNYGFFKKVMEGYLEEIRKEAKAREADLLEQLEGFKRAEVQGLSAEVKEKRANRIREMIREQNYTVAEDLLARLNATEEEREELIEEDFLKDFLDNYDDYYQPVATHKASFATLVSKRTRNKEERGAKKLADNWLPGGSLLRKDRLANLLSSLGFKVSLITPQKSIGKFEHYFVQTARAKGGQRDNYTHPIAAFGSGATQEGFRIICINGAYDADGLIDVMKLIGNAKHTLILFDYALSKSERRRLARKSKNALGDKLFAVLDRTVLMFLVRNYDETKMNRMLISLVTPFGYYQPYVWESANVMPPEIFMGRKHELERIKSPTGVNIVYGGRQLGKSALLKKAKEDVDRDENGNRAVIVDVKGLDYKRAAKKIGHELYDSSVLDDDIDTEDWDELARAVRRRLQSDEKRIPYLLLLLDEADVFIDSCASVNYQPFDALKDIQSIGSGRFKFVIAGLRNIVRFKREALGNNSVLTHLEPMTVKPFNTSEARELMEIPLHYLGLRFPKENESLITLILATTNYFPGLIQMYCAKLIAAMRNKDYANYDEVDTPIYEVSEEHIKKVLADLEFTQQIREKFIITLKLDEDNYYYLIALLMAFLYHNNGYNEGYSALDIKKAGTELEIGKIANLDITKLETFMEELKELNVLRNTEATHYLFTRFQFFQMMGTRVEVDDELEKYMGE